MARGTARAHARLAAMVAAAIVLAVAGGWLGVRLAGTERQQVGPLDTTMSLRPSTDGGTTVETPPLGTLRLETHDAPVRLHVQVEGLDAEEARRIAANPQRLTGLEERAVADVRAGVEDLLLRTAVAALLGATLLALLVLRRVRAGLVAASTAAALTGLGYYATWSTWNPASIREPRYTGLLSSAPTVVGDARDIVADFSRYRGQLARLVANVSSLYSATSTLPVMAQPEEDLVRVLHVSDLHLAPQAWDVVATVARQYDVDVVVDSGDITDHGSAAENRYLDGVRRVEAPYVWVRGNHDSMSTQRAMARIPNAVVLNGRPRQVAGLRFLGVGDPTFTPDKREPATQDAVVAQAHALADRAREGGGVDVVVYHDPGPAAVFDGLARMVMSGHWHRHSHDLMPGGTWRLLEGSTGGSGLRALEPDDGPAPIELSVLYVDRETAELRASDHIRLGGLGETSARIQRHVVDPEEPVSEMTTPTPTQPVPESPVPSPTVSNPFPTPTPAPNPTPTAPSLRR